MATGVKAQRPVRLSEEETLTSFDDWKNNLIFYLNQEKTFAPETGYEVEESLRCGREQGRRSS